MEEEEPSIRKCFQDALKGYTELGGWTTFKNGEWLWAIVQKSFNSYWNRATSDYFFTKYPDMGADQIARKLITVAAKNASVLGGITGSTASTNEIVAIFTGFEGGIGLPANLAAATASFCAESILLVRIQLHLVTNLGRLYDVPLDPEDPEDILTILAFALGGAAADAAGKAGMKIGGKAAGLGAKSVFSKDILAVLKRIGSKIGVKISQHSIVKYTVPIASIGIGTECNYVATRNVGRIAIQHFGKRVSNTPFT